MCTRLLLTSLFLSFIVTGVKSYANTDGKRLFDDLIGKYTRIRRPVMQPAQVIDMKLRLILSQIIDVKEKDQVMTTSVWLEQEWHDPYLRWNPADYGNTTFLYIPSEMIWTPDIALYNTAEGFYNVTLSVKAKVSYNGNIHWKPPAVFKSFCEITVEWFPFDEQECRLKFGSWSHNALFIELTHMDSDRAKTIVEPDDKTGEDMNVSVLDMGVDICDLTQSVEWDIIHVPARRHSVKYNACCPGEAFQDITYYLKIRRKPLYYTVNLIFPCVGISFLTILVFYLPSHGGEKVTLCISILVALTVFFLLLTEIIPATSTHLPLIGKYLLFTMLMVSISVVVTVFTINIHFRTPKTHRMPNWIKKVFLKWLPLYLFMRRPISYKEPSFRRVSARSFSTEMGPSLQRRHAAVNLAIRRSNSRRSSSRDRKRHSPLPFDREFAMDGLTVKDIERLHAIYKSPLVLRAFENVCFIAERMRLQDFDDKVDEDWKYVALVIDRLFLWIFSAACFFGTIIILLGAPQFYDRSPPLGKEHCLPKFIYNSTTAAP